MHDDLLKVASRRARAWFVVAGAMAGVGPVAIGLLVDSIVGGVAVGVVAAAAMTAWLLAGAPGTHHKPWPAAAMRPPGLEVANINEGIAIASGEPPANAAEVAHPAPNVAGWEVPGRGRVLLVTDGASQLLTRDELEAVCAAQLAIAHDPTCRRLDGAVQVVRLGRILSVPIGIGACFLLFSVAAVVVVAGFVPLFLAPWLLGGRVRWWSTVAADAVCVRTTRHPDALVRGLRAVARWNGQQVKAVGLLGNLGVGGTAWVVPVGLNWSSQTMVNGRVVDKRTAAMVEDTRLLVRAGLVRRVCLEGAEASLASYDEVTEHVRAAGQAAAQGGVAWIEGELVGLEGVVPAQSPPAWHPDPAGRARLRWWDGARWTDHTSS